MSMISSQCNKLRDTAMRVEIFLEGSTDAIPMDTHKQLRDAADTILELREMAQKANDENERLRELVRAAWRCIHTGVSCSDCRLIAGGCTLQTAMREMRIEVE